MSMPLDEFSSVPVPSDFLPPDDRARASLLVDYEMGGFGLSDATMGLMYQVWEARLSGNDIQVKPESGSTWTTITSDTGITELSICFDQNMRCTVAYVAAGVAKLYWYDTLIPDFTTTIHADVSSPVVTMDDKRASQTGMNDILFFYVKAGSVYYRQQRDRFGVERLLGLLPDGTTRIARWGMSVGGRIQLEFGTDAGSTAPGAAAYTDLLTDKLYVSVSTSVVPLFVSDTPLTGTWRSRALVDPSFPALAWLRAADSAQFPITVKLYGDGVLWHTAVLTTAAPVRLPPGRFRSVEVEVIGDGNVPHIALASSSGEIAAIFRSA